MAKLLPSFERALQRVFRGAGLDLHRYRPESSEFGRLASMLAYHGVDLVFDVGANVGQFSHSLRKAGYAGKLVSFEPLSAAHGQLVRASQGVPNWEVAPRVALGDGEGEIDMHVAGNSVSSSPLEMLGEHASAAPDSGYVGVERVHLSRLDTAAHSYLQPGVIPFLKIDTQGYEDRVLDGASNLLKQVKGLQLETSFVPLYEGQQLFDQVVDRLQTLGFSIWAIWPGFCNPRSGRMLQVDVTFFRD